MTSAMAQTEMEAEESLIIDEETGAVVNEGEVTPANPSYVRPDGVFFIGYSEKRSGLSTAYMLGPAYADVTWTAKVADGVEPALAWTYTNAAGEAVSVEGATLTTNSPYNYSASVPVLTATQTGLVETFCAQKPSSSETKPGPILRSGRGCPSSTSSGLFYAGNYDTKYTNSLSTSTTYYLTNGNVYKVAQKYTKAKYADEATLNWFGEIFEYSGTPYSISSAIFHGKNASADAPAAPKMNVVVRALVYTEGSTSTSLGDTIAIGSAEPVETSASNKAYSYLATLTNVDGSAFATGRLFIEGPIAVLWSVPEDDTVSQMTPYYMKQNAALQQVRKSYSCFSCNYHVPADAESGREESTGSLWGRLALSFTNADTGAKEIMHSFCVGIDAYYSYAYCETNELQFAALDAEPQTVSVTTPFYNTSVKITLSDGSELPSWIHVTLPEDTSSDVFTVSVDNNYDEEEAREETIMFSAREASHKVLVSQAAAPEGTAIQMIEATAEAPAFNLYGQKAGKSDAVIIKGGKVQVVK